ncbi:hypothetical protein C8J57DRAFT_1561458, partial [Mycena rebaudengoi]
GADEDSGGVGEKLVDVRRELKVLRGLCASIYWAWMRRMWLYVDLVEDALWIWIERSLADMVGLMEEGLGLQEPRIIALLMSDVSFFFFRARFPAEAPRDLRSDNLLLNGEVVSFALDFSNAVQIKPESPRCAGPVSVPYWQAPEVDATVWALAEARPPSSDTEPPVSEPALYSPAFHEFSRLCSEPVEGRAEPGALLLETPFIHCARGEPAIIQLLPIEQALRPNLRHDVQRRPVHFTEFLTQASISSVDQPSPL